MLCMNYLANDLTVDFLISNLTCAITVQNCTPALINVREYDMTLMDLHLESASLLLVVVYVDLALETFL